MNGRVYGYPGAGGGNNSDPGGNGGNSMHIASFLEIRNGDFTSKIRGGGGGGGGMDTAAMAGGGHGSVKRCSGYFCCGSKKKCEKNGGKYGEGDGGKDGKGKDTNGLEMLGTKLTEQKAEKVVRKVKRRRTWSREKVETVDLEQEEVSSAAMVLKVIMDRSGENAESRKVIAVSEETVTEDHEQVWR